MKNFEIDVDINGKFTFEVKAKSKEEAQLKVDEILENKSLRKIIENYNNNLVVNTKVKTKRELERL